ncbi:hypothetical protein SAMN04487785_1179 [Dyella jiangningensis]|uniref:hypothetical protein n=1 Tax=Dyella sp. AtDHG13 TaxID=1938897 RepID=UPI0008870DDE|nr:hypothetical protein [Dyella sp. AtDHG13]PXV59073.1 hypothetical protein BDW41_104117 [Dyella sp. AtDHG13]SDL27312.1 hypothetical protein SAMN04487785_1179 [Dyella jiangningensis]
MDTQEMARTQALLMETTQMQRRLLEQSTLLIESQKQENAQLRGQLAQATAALRQASGQLEAGGQRLGHEALQVISDSARRVLADNAARAMGQIHQQAETTAKQLASAADAAREQSRQLNRAQTTMVWKSLALMAVGAVLLAGGAGLWAWTSGKEAQRYRVEAELGRRISQSDLIQCGDGLCANVDAEGERVGDQKQYVPVKSR